MTEDHNAEQIRLDARNLRGIAHPVRVRILAILRTDGPTTATALAHRLGMNTGATSYHLRQLAEHGFIVDIPTRGTRRERWWKAAQWNTVFPEDELLMDDTGLGAVFLRSVAQVWIEGISRAVDALPTLPEEWRAAQDFSDYLFKLTPAQAKDLGAEIHGVLKRHRATDLETLQEPTEGTARVTFQFQMFPNPEDLTLRDDAAAMGNPAGSAAAEGHRLPRQDTPSKPQW
ncbi:MAG: ArsR/SmtB family transcription factor [Nocardioidaceae bacterium]